MVLEETFVDHQITSKYPVGSWHYEYLDISLDKDIPSNRCHHKLNKLPKYIANCV